MQERIDVALRLFDLAELPLVQLWLFGLLGQLHAPAIEHMELHVHVMAQRLIFSEVQDVRRGLNRLLQLEETATLTIRNWDYAAPYDLRAPLLNWALEISEGRYFICLDSNEQLRPGGLAMLFDRLALTGAAAAIGGIASQRVIWWGDAFLPIEPAQAAFADEAPGPVFLLDRLRSNSNLWFQADVDQPERTEFIRRLRQDHVVDEVLSDDSICIRQLT